TKNVSAETGREKPNTQPKTNQPTPQHQKALQCWTGTKIKNPKITGSQKLPTNPHPDGAKTRVGNMHHALT
ncbi:hypothetical protein QP172_12005, partial [Corynebacterium coyleae]|uniref:hypothetical protein n=1 Tax=Corynebacterium coyleae TaxID=53374 RepID=UPI00254DD199